MAGVTLVNTSKIYPGVKHAAPAVNAINLNVNDHEFVALIGPSGCGKSTTLRMIAGLESVTSGEIYIGDTLVNDLPPRSRNIAMVFQNYALYPTLTNFENIAFGLRVAKMPKYKITEEVNRVARALELDGMLDRYPRQLSGGQRQRVALGRAIVRDPQVFLLDEPLSNLDAKMRVQMRYELIELHKKLNTTTVYVTHDQIEAMTMAHRIVIMDRGVVQQIGTPTEVYTRPANTFVGSFIGTPPMNFIEGRIEVVNDKPYFDNTAIRIEITQEQYNKVAASKAHSVYLGVRPENIHPVALTEEDTKHVIKGHVRFSELIGADQNVHVDIGKRDRIIVRMPTDTLVQDGELIALRVNVNRILFYDMNSGNLVS
ncbi:MAG: sn-glycerol-3-phosphate ABC transporter ATP-binding protein UgpC [Defluviitaleaceae bacterium]|nr:sn-glycerol-3-phosphate ABC transporter ATP-binding protein UgpC [Defluviitaleaceae bacterium]